MMFTLNETAEGCDYGDEGQHNADANNTGHKCARSSLIQKLQEHFGDVSLCYVHQINGQLEWATWSWWISDSYCSTQGRGYTP